MGFGFFYLAEYLNLFIVSAVAATVFWEAGCLCTFPVWTASIW